MASATLRTCFAALALCMAVAKSGGASVGEDVDEFELPQGLLFGAGVSAVQTEGAWNLSGKVESVADRLLHSEQLHALMQFKGSHDVAANSYHRYKDDVAKAKELKLQLYRFSISWARLLPTTNPAEVNEEGRKYYHDLIQEIKKNGMTPMVTLYHFDHPQSLQDEFLGWESDKMIDKFATYADYVFKEYGDEVKLWTTINEPNQYCMYFNMLFALSGLVKESDMNIHRCMHNSILAHAKVYRQYQRKYYPSQQGQVGFTALLIHAEPMSTSQQDIYAADAFNQLHCGQVLHPVVFGDYPNIVKKLLPSKEFIPFTEAEKADLEGSTDFIGLNVYDGLKAEYSSTASDSRQNVPPMYTQLLESLQFVKFDKDESQLLQFDKISPDIMTRSLVWTWTQYGVPIIITENGFSGAGLQDHDRAAYYSVNLRTLVTTIRSYGVKVLAYCAWSLIDAFEWSAGYSRPFGLIYVDYDKGTLDRSLKQSAEFFISLADSRKVPYVAPSSASTTVAPLVALVLPFLLLKISSP